MDPVKTIKIFEAAVAANICGFAAGTCIGWTSPMGLKLKAEDTSDSPLNRPINSSDDSWISSTIALGALIAPFVAGPLADEIGRKLVLLSSSILFLVAYVLMLVATKILMILFGRLVQGFGVGFVMTVLPMYAGEISTKNVRGATGSLMQLFISSGVLYSYAIGPYVSYYTFQYYCLAVPIVFVAVFLFMPESPYYHVKKGAQEKALRSLQFLRGQSLTIVQDELTQIQKEVEEAISKKVTVSEIFKVPGNRKALFISVGLMAFHNLCGIYVVVFNVQEIFESANTGLDTAVATITIGIIQVIASALTPLFLADRLGRRVILLASASVMTFGLAGLGAFFYMKLVIDDISKVSWLPLPSLIIYFIAYCMGFGPLPWTIMGEMFSANIKSISASICASSCWIWIFVVTFSYPMLEAIGSYYAFWLYAIFCVFAIFHTLFIVMETKGLSLQEIQDRLNGRKIEKFDQVN